MNVNVISKFYLVCCECDYVHLLEKYFMTNSIVENDLVNDVIVFVSSF